VRNTDVRLRYIMYKLLIAELRIKAVACEILGVNQTQLSLHIITIKNI
jgi:hypothetical protein